MHDGYIIKHDDNIVYIYIMDEIYKEYSTRTETSNFPTIVKLKTTEAEIKLKLADYKKAHKDYVNNLRQGETKDAEDNLDKMNKLSDSLSSLYNNLKLVTNTVYPKGIQNQEIVSAGSADLTQIDSQLGEYYVKIDKVQSELQDIKGRRQSTSLETKSARMQYYIFTILAIWWVTAFILLYYFRNSSLSGLIEIMILTIAILAIGYFIYVKIKNYKK